MESGRRLGAVSDEDAPGGGEPQRAPDSTSSSCPGVAWKPQRTMGVAQAMDHSEGQEAHRPTLLPNGLLRIRFLRPLQDFRGQGQGDLRQEEEGVLVMAQLEFPSNLAGWVQHLCLKNKLM